MSDIDIVLVMKFFPVVTNVLETQQYESCLLLIQDHNTPPGYAKLQRVRYGVPQTRSQFSILRSGHRVDTENRLVWCVPDELRLPGSVLHGPASTIEGPGVPVPKDLVLAVRCNTWPDCASEWLTRTRRYNYPTQDQINKCKDLGFFLVYVGHPNSQENHLQWRISFSLQERLLVINFNAVQLKCYILAKMIKKEFIHKSLGEKSLTSYHFKTLMFYMIEETPADFWAKHNLLYCHHILKRMLIWVERGDCPNYFIPGENMFEGKISEQMQLQLCGLLRRLIDAKFKYLVTIASDYLGDRYQEALVSGVQASRYPPLGDFCCKIHTHNRVRNLFMFRTALLCCDIENQSTNRAAKRLYELKVRMLMTERVTEHSVEEVRRAVSLLVPYVDIQLISLLVVLAKRRSRSRAYTFNLLTSEKWHALSLESDMFSSKLKQASLLCMLDCYETSLGVLDTLENQMRQSVSVCSCSEERPHAGRQLLSLPMCSFEEFLHCHLIPCVIFLPAERLLTPPALCYEMTRLAGSPRDSKKYWYDCAVVDGKVLLYYLLYLNHSRLGLDTNASAYTGNIRWLIRTDNLLCHRETALNILGWIHKERGLADRAVECFRESLSIQPSHNAATLHLQDICQNRTRTC